MPAKKTSSKAKRAPARRKTPRKAAPRTRGIQPQDCVIDTLPAEASEAAQRIESEGGVIVGRYFEPLGRNPLLLAALPIDSVDPTPFQRDLSDAHHKKLSEVIDRTGLFLDPVIAITAPEKGFWTPNGRHRLEALRRLGAKSIVALVVPKREIAWQILALNTEKAHNLRERALEVIRIYKGLIEEDASRPEKDFSFYLEDPALVTLGLCYERKGNFAGGAYHSILRRLMEFSAEPLRKAIGAHESAAEKLFELDTLVTEAVDKLKERGLVSPYLRAFVVARINPLRWIKDEPPPLAEVLRTMRERAARFNVDKIRQQDLARSGGAPDSE
ncbi:MAG TPA: ParB N-terminal domain-containing protein [Povalibacter sp.]|uniref:ParB N-terminal domain-containing protein n=1 Tax=Povalibacter sp. TaxID=1962978 RepID=UPI002BFD5CA0|nr:ParB N-terminal domain-containing protein [Povalibacter sp.]HMN47441.1 ParB N-terminal domain-containing protein [Povalibacter sp.]